MAKINVAVAAGGFSAEREISLLSAKTVMDNLDPGKYNAYLLDISKSAWLLKVEGRDCPIDLNKFAASTQDGQTIDIDFVFIAIHGSPGEDGLLQAYLEMMNVPHSSADVLCSSLAFDKFRTKEFVKEERGLHLAKGSLVTATDIQDLDSATQHLSFPLFVKPNTNGSSFGISKVRERNDLRKALLEGLEYDDVVLVEEAVEGREITCGVFREFGEIVALPLTEIVTHNDFFDYKAKYERQSEEITPAPIEKEYEAKCKDLSIRLYHKLNCQGVVRFDYILNGDKIYFLEVNTVPGLSPESLVPQQVLASGRSLATFFDTLIKDRLS